MARLLGRYQVPGCCPGTKAGLAPGPDCSGGGPMGTRAAKRAEDREVAAEIAVELAESGVVSPQFFQVHRVMAR